jgi:hydroxymethylbilane synthase
VPLDAFVSNKYASLEDIPPGGVVGTSSLRREAQLHARFPYLSVTSLRGNLDTRLRKLDEGQYDAIILAAAGLTRLGLVARIRAVLPAELSLPAAGQGALGIEALAARPEVAAWMAPLADAGTAACVRAERAVSRALAGSCEVPLGAYAEMTAAGCACAASSPRPTAAAWPARNCAASPPIRKRSARRWPTNCGRAARKRSWRRWAHERLAWPDASW